MGTISQKLNRVKQTKNELKDAINIGGSQITDNTIFNSYADEIKDIYIDAINNGTDNIYNSFPKTTKTGFKLDLDTEEGKMKLIPKAVQIEQLNTPTVENPQNIHITTGINNIKLQNKNLFNYKDTTNVSSGIVVDDDGWITVSYDNSSGSSTKYFNYYTHNLNLKTDTDYNIFLEIKNVSGTGRVYFCSTGNQSQMKTSYAREFNIISSNNTYSQIAKTKSSFAGTKDGIRIFLQFAAGQSGSITFRHSVLEDTSLSVNDFVYTPYQSQSFPISLGNIEYCEIADYTDQFFKNTTDSEFYDSTLLENEWYLKKNITKHLFDGDINKDTYNFSTDLTNVLAINLLLDNIDIPLIKPRNTYALYSDKFTYINNVNNIEHIYISQPITTSTGWMGNIRLYINHDRLEGYSSSLTNEQKRDLVINWLQQNPLTTYYIARYPETIHISQTDYPILTSQLENLYNNAKSYEGKTYITTTNNDEENLLLEIEVSALAKIE